MYKQAPICTVNKILVLYIEKNNKYEYIKEMNIIIHWRLFN